MPFRRPVNEYSPSAFGERRGNDIAGRVQQIDPHAFEQQLGIVEVALGSGVGMDRGR